MVVFMERQKQENIWRKHLVKKKKLLREKMQTLQSDEMKDYIAMDGLLEELEKIMFENKE